jgi:tetratricopeptide repeat protein 21B
LYFCKQLTRYYFRPLSFSNDIPLALKELNMARKDSEWGAPSIFQMVEIYLNPDHEAVWDEANEGKGRADNANAVDAAMKLLCEVQPISKFYKTSFDK